MNQKSPFDVICDAVTNICMVIIAVCVLYIGCSAVDKAKQIDKRLQNIEMNMNK